MLPYFPGVEFYRSFSIEKPISGIAPIPVVAVMGRSNSGKSSLINSLCNRKDLAKTSSLPGKTRTVNFYRVHGYKNHYREFYLADLPGYGFAKASIQEIASIQKVINMFLQSQLPVKLMLILIDSRRSYGVEEFTLFDYCFDRNIPFLVVRTKWDKLSQKERSEALQKWKLEPHLFERTIPVSALKKENIPLLAGRIVEILHSY